MHTQSNLVVANAFTHKYKKDLKLGSVVYIPIMTEGSASDVTPGTEPTAANASATGTSITVNQWKEHTVEISDMADVEDHAEYLSNAAKSSAYVINKVIDRYVSSLISTLGGSTYPNSDGDTFTDETFISMVESLDTEDVPDDGRFVLADPSTKSDMLKIDKFVRQDYINGAPTTNGKFGMLYGANVLITNNLTPTTVGSYGVYAHPNAIGVVIQGGPRARLWDLGYKFVTKIITDTFYGSAVIRSTFGKAFYTRSY